MSDDPARRLAPLHCAGPFPIEVRIRVTALSDNPLLKLAAAAVPPAFGEILPEHAEPALDQLLADNRKVLAQVLAQAAEATEPPSWDSLVAPLDEAGDALSRAWSPVSHLFSVSNSPEWRKAYNACLPKLTEYGLEVSQSAELCAAYKALKASKAYAGLSASRRRVIDNALRDFHLSGVDLPAQAKERYRQISLRLSELTTKFEENLLDATQSWSLLITDEARLAGMTADGKRQAAAKAKSREQDGWLLTLDFPSFDSVISYADDRSLREALYTAYVTRASDQGPHADGPDNAPLMEEILALRHEEAQLLGFANFAEVSLATKMAESPAQIEAFLLELAAKARPGAERDLAELSEFARQRDGLDELRPWDLAYYTDKLKQQKLGLSDEQLRPFFPAPQVIDGLFELTSRLYGVRFAADHEVPVWHPTVTAYRVLNADGDTIGRFYLDPYAREHKRSGAWMDECQGRRRGVAGLQLPVAYLVCNFTPPLDGELSLLTHDEVLTLFHEFGHGLHHLLTQIEESDIAGIHGVAWDAVELPSQFMENWCYEPEALALFARHHETGETLPDEMVKQLRESRRFHAGLGALRQVEFALFDLRLHRDYEPAQGARVMAVLEAVRDEVAVLRPPAFNRFPNSFSHIFAGGYAAGYYSYKWAEVLSSDAFAAFEEEGLFNPATAARFRDEVLARGGSADAAELFRAFRGRDPSIDALLRHEGLVEAAA